MQAADEAANAAANAANAAAAAATDVASNATAAAENATAAAGNAAVAAENATAAAIGANTAATEANQTAAVANETAIAANETAIAANETAANANQTAAAAAAAVTQIGVAENGTNLTEILWGDFAKTCGDYYQWSNLTNATAAQNNNTEVAGLNNTDSSAGVVQGTTNANPEEASGTTNQLIATLNSAQLNGTQTGEGSTFENGQIIKGQLYQQIAAFCGQWGDFIHKNETNANATAAEIAATNTTEPVEAKPVVVNTTEPVVVNTTEPVVVNTSEPPAGTTVPPAENTEPATLPPAAEPAADQPANP